MVDNPKSTKSETAAPGESGSALRAGAARQSFAEKLVEDLVLACARYFDVQRVGAADFLALDQLRDAKRNVIGALTVPTRTEEDDFLSVRDQFLMAALPVAERTANEMSAETAAKVAGVAPADYRWREHWPKVLIVLAADIADVAMSARRQP